MKLGKIWRRQALTSHTGAKITLKCLQLRQRTMCVNFAVNHFRLGMTQSIIRNSSLKRANALWYVPNNDIFNYEKEDKDLKLFPFVQEVRFDMKLQ